MAQYWTFVNAGAVSTGANPAPALPASIVAGDFLIIVAAAAGTSYSATPPSGWTNVTLQTSDPRLSVWYRQYNGVAGAPTLTNAATSCAAVMLAYRKVGSFDAASAVTTATSTSPATTNQVTTKQADDLVLSLYAATATAADTWTPDVNTTSRVNQSSTVLVVGLLCCDEDQAAAGASAVRTATLSPTGEAWDAIAVAFTSNPLGPDDADIVFAGFNAEDIEEEILELVYDSKAVDPLSIGQFFNTEAEM